MKIKYNSKIYNILHYKQCAVCTIEWKNEIDTEARLDWHLVGGLYYCPDHVPAETNYDKTKI